MILLAILSAIQICLLPGLTIYTLFFHEVKLNKILIPPIIFALSLLINYLLVEILLILNLFEKIPLLVILTSEIIYLSIYFANNRKLILTNLSVFILKLYKRIKAFLIPKFSLVYLFKIGLFVWSLFIIIKILSLSIENIGDIFNAWDAVVSWNRWATDIYNGVLPNRTYGYPILIPANWAISYILFEYPLQFLARGIMPIFFIFIMITSLLLGVTKKQGMNYLFVPPFLTLLLNSYWTDGMMDIPMAFITFIIIILLFERKKYKKYQSQEERKFFILMLLLISTASLIKIAGLLFFFAIPILYIKMIKEDKRQINLNLKDLFTVFLLIPLPYFVFSYTRIILGYDISVVSWVTNGIFHGLNYIQRFVNATFEFYNSFANVYEFLSVLILFILSFNNKRIRLVNLMVTIPYFLIWGLFFSYDLRNLYLIYPLLGLSGGTGIQELIKLNFKIIVSNTFIRSLILFMIVASVTFIFYIYSNNSENNSRDHLIRKHNEREKEIGDPLINQKIYRHLDNEISNRKGLILSNYQYLNYLPDLKDRFKLQAFERKSENDYSEFIKNISTGSIDYILYPSYTHRDIQNYIDAQISNKKMKLIFDVNGFKFIEIIR